MARLEIRCFGRQNEIKHLLVVSENANESLIIDETLGDKDFPISITGEVCLSDGYGQHYIRLLRKP